MLSHECKVTAHPIWQDSDPQGDELNDAESGISITVELDSDVVRVRVKSH